MASQIDTSPYSRSNLSYLDLDQKRRCKDADPNKGRCLLENQIESIEFCHCIPRKFIDDDELVCA